MSGWGREVGHRDHYKGHIYILIAEISKRICFVCVVVALRPIKHF